MWFNSLLLKIETGQQLTENQEKRLAKYLMLVPSVFRIFVDVIFLFSATILFYIGIIGGFEPISQIAAFIGGSLLVILVLIMMFLPRRFRIKTYLETIEKYYQTAFKGYDEFDLYYIDQHISPHIRPLSTPKVYLLTDGYHYLFMSDPFKNTIYKLPRYLSTNKQSSYLRVINKDVNEESKIMVRLDDIEHFYISSKNIPKAEVEKQTKQTTYLKYFFDQSSKYDAKCVVVLKLKAGVILRLSHEVYPIFKDLMGHKEANHEL